MRFIIVLSVLFYSCAAWAEPPALPLPWVKLSEIYYTPSQSRVYGPGNAVDVLTHLSSGNIGPQIQNTPVTVDLVPFGVSADAKVAWLGGILIITHGTTNEVADMLMTFAADGDTIDCTKYIGQSAEAYIGGGQRQTMFVAVPLNAGKFQFCYSVATPGAWPTNSSYGINLSLQGWGR